MKTISYPTGESLSLTVSRMLALKQKLNAIESTKTSGDKATAGNIVMYFGDDTNSIKQIIDFSLKPKTNFDKDAVTSTIDPNHVDVILGDTQFTLSQKHLDALTEVLYGIVEDMQNSIRTEAQDFKDAINESLSALDA